MSRKIYFVIVDAFPMLPELHNIAKEKGVSLLRQVSHCFTMTFLASAMTGKLPSDLEKQGIGEHTYRKYQRHDDDVHFTWTSKMLFDILHNLSWDIHIHNGDYLYHYLLDAPYFKHSTGHPEGPKGERRMGWEDPKIKEITLGRSSGSAHYYEEEFEWIRSTQRDRPLKDSFYWIRYPQYHDLNTCPVLEKVDVLQQWLFKLLRVWDFTEPDSLFYICADHGPWRNPDLNPKHVHPLPDHYYTWVLFKDGIAPAIVQPAGYISITDFFFTVMSKVGNDSHNAAGTIAAPLDMDRTYFVEDGRVGVDPMNSTLAMAVKLVDWEDGIPRGILQVSYFKPTNEWKCCRTGLSLQGLPTLTQPLEMNTKLQRALQERFSWAK